MGYYTNQMLVEFLCSIKEKVKQKSAEKNTKDGREKQGKNPPDSSR